MMNKQFLLFQGPVRSRSGYGDHTRDLLTSLVKMDKYDIQIAATKWGDCSETGLDLNNPDHAALNSRILTTNQLKRQPDVYINCSVPNEFNPVGKYNIGITAGIETTACDASWLEGCNKMDLIIVPSEHSKNILQQTTYDRFDQKTKQKVGELKLEKPIEVLFEGLDLDIYRKVDETPVTINTQLDSIDEDFCFLYVGHWLSGKLGHDRKDTGMLIKTFCQAFKGEGEKPALILKTSSATFSILDRTNILNRIDNIKSELGPNCPNIYVLHGDLTANEVNGLYNHTKVKAHVSFTKGEGFGRPLLEASVSEKPVIASGWSGQVDFLHPEYSTLLPGQLKPVHRSAQWKGVINDGTQWFYVDYNIAEKVLRDVYSSYDKYIPLAEKQAEFSISTFSMDKMNEKFEQLLSKHTTQQVELKLPQLKKLNKEGSAPKMNLPKLKKV